MHKLIAIGLGALLLVGCVKTPNGLSAMSDQEAIATAKKRIADDLKDPYSAHWGDHWIRKTHAWGQEFDRVCGTINAKNSFGAYTGFKVVAYNLVNDTTVFGDNAVLNCSVS